MAKFKFYLDERFLNEQMIQETQAMKVLKVEQDNK
jgi:hypothetical protein